MSTLQYKCIRTSTILFMGLKTRCKQSEYFTWWGVPNVNIRHMPLPILYCGTVMEALHNAVPYLDAARYLVLKWNTYQSGEVRRWRGGQRADDAR